MRIIVVSDTHRDFFVLKEIVEQNTNAELFIHLGDGENELRDVQTLFPERVFLFVRGNCDYASMAKTVDTVSVGEAKIFFTHGHLFDVHSSPDRLLAAAREQGASVALYGHTHLSATGYRDGVHLLNPGSPTSPRGGRKPSYGVIDVTDAGIVPHIVELTKAGDRP